MNVLWPCNEYNNQINLICEKLEEAQNIFCIAHPYADGDALGSQLALYHYCKSVGKNCVCLNFDPIPEQISWLSGTELCTNSLPENVNFDLAFLMETTEAKRMGDRVSFFEKASHLIHLDHHVEVKGLGHTNILDEKASSTCEILYNILEKTGKPLNKECREALYVGIMTDTGNFRYNNATSRAHEVTAKIIGNDISVDDIYKLVYENTSYNRVLMHGITMARTESLCNGKLFSSWLKQEDFEKNNASEVDADGVIRHLSCIKGNEIAILFRELDTNKVKISFRSSGKIDVLNLSREFGGGGHTLAAGATIEGKIDEVKPRVLSAASKAINSL
ncbi:MAG: bifunctional oligoribonuclease/PAP phosphatase NrnA [Candidatus Riflebacteria bacterium]|nr:bifunctional oligoribonuclease/PAP phosphatase NrnA [Candidatus Riflebacteria bacterium]